MGPLVALAAAGAALAGCGLDSLGDGGGARATATPPVLPAARARLAGLTSYLISYGPLDAAAVELARRTPLVVLHPRGGDLTRELVSLIQRGMSADDPGDDPVVLCYVSIGEDLRTAQRADDELRADPRFRGDGSGPRVDPRGPDADGAPLDHVDPRGAASNGGGGFAPYYLDDDSVDRSPDRRGDGLPDRNGRFGAAFVNAGAPGWYEAVDAMTLDGPDGIAGLREVLTADYGRGLGCDGVFLDTLDTAAPNAFTDATSANQSEFEWTAPGFAAFVARLRRTYPDRLVLQNRGLFFFDPRFPQYEFTTRGNVDLVMFESYRLDSSGVREWDPVHYGNNRYQVAPKLMAEAGRPDGFRVLSLGYAAGPPGGIPIETLLGGSDVGMSSLLEDIRVTQELAGFRHYISDAQVKVVSSFVRDHASLEDHAPPVWTSTYEDHAVLPAEEPTPRVGIQEAVPGARAGEITVRWDVALDMHDVRYVALVSDAPIDFDADPNLSRPSRTPLVPEVGDGYARGVGPGRYPYQATLSGLVSGHAYQILVRAVDGTPDANEDQNRTVVTATAR